MFSLKSFLYNQVYINIIENTKKTVVYVEEVSFNGSIQNQEELFDSSKKQKINEYIEQNIRKSPIHYISILDNSLSQGATPTCASSEMAQFCDMGAVNHICYTKDWGYYTSKLDILEFKNKYKKFGLDFIFSPFLVLAKFFKDKVSGELSLYVLIGADSLTLSIYKESKLVFAEYIDMQNQNEFQDELSIDSDKDEEEELSLDDDVGINLEDIDVEDEMDSLDDFDDIEDLDTFDEMDEFSEDENEEIGETIAPTLDDENGFGEDYHRFSLIQSAINKFYKDDRFSSDFIQQVFIADSVGMNNDLKKFLEEEMFLSVFIRKIDLAVEICEAAKAEKK